MKKAFKSTSVSSQFCTASAITLTCTGPSIHSTQALIETLVPSAMIDIHVYMSLSITKQS